ncbi:MAG: tetratricopeptide repeat protein [Rhodanobacter sp.]|jgi:tetratricopeptide (TPR) repeat protein|nr:tetratricopeptide repeat protein [Rhodanobacter sp.]
MLKDSIELHRQGRLDEAEQGYRAQLAAKPDDADALYLLGMLRYQRGDGAEGAHLLERARVLAPHSADIELALASLRFRDGDYAAAKPHFERALALDPNLGGAHAGMGEIALMEGDRERAEHYFRVALRTGEEPHALAGLGALLMERGDMDGALRHLGRAAEVAPYDAMIQMMFGQALMRRDTPAFAEQAFASALRLRPDLHQARYWLGSALVRQTRYAEAASNYRALLDVPEFSVPAQLGLADIARNERRWEEAASGYRAVLAMEPTQAAATRALAWTLVQRGLGDEAVAVYDAYLAILPDDRPMRTARADLLMLIGRLADADAAWKTLLDEHPADAHAHARRATLAEQQGHLEAAVVHAGSAAALQPDNAEAALVKVRALLRAGDNARAREALESLGQRPLQDMHNRLCWNYLGRLHDLAGETAAAVRCFGEAQRGLADALPPLDAPHAELVDALAETPASPWERAPILLLGAPGSGVDQVAAVLSAQAGLSVLRDRAGSVLRDDDFNRPRFAYYCGGLSEADRAALRERYLAPLRAMGIALDRPIIDWLPRWDAHLLALLRRVMPGTRLIIVEREPCDTLLNWLAFGFVPGFPCADALAAAQWLARARRHLAWGSAGAEPRRWVLAADALLDHDERTRTELARFIGVDTLENLPAPRGLGGLPVRFAPGHAQAYRETLAEAFAALTDDAGSGGAA